MPSPYPIHPVHACPSPILSQPMHALPLFYPSPCMPSPYAIPLYRYACPLPILSHPMHVLPLFYPSPCTLSLYSILAHAHPSLHKPPQYSILFYSSPCMSSYSLSHTLKACSPLTSEYALLNPLTLSISHHLPSLVIWSINFNTRSECLLFSFTWAHHMNYTYQGLVRCVGQLDSCFLHIRSTVKLDIYHIITTYIVYHYSSVDITHSST